MKTFKNLLIFHVIHPAYQFCNPGTCTKKIHVATISFQRSLFKPCTHQICTVFKHLSQSLNRPRKINSDSGCNFYPDSTDSSILKLTPILASVGQVAILLFSMNGVNCHLPAAAEHLSMRSSPKKKWWVRKNILFIYFFIVVKKAPCVF